MEIKSTKKRQIPKGDNLKISILLPYFNEKIGLELYETCNKTLLKNGVKKYEGYWKMGRQHGRGKYYLPDHTSK